MEIEKPVTLDILDTNAPALSATSDMPVETKPEPVVEAPAVPSTEEEAEQLEESATSTTETPGQSTEKTPRGVGKKIAELTKARAEAEARAKQAEENLKAALELKAKVEPEDPEPVKPSKDTFTDPDAYDAAILAYADEKAAHTARRQVKEMLAEQEQKAQQAQIEEGQRLTREAYNARLDVAKGKYADFEEVALSPDVQVSMPVATTIMMSEMGPDLQYYLGKNPQEAARIIKLSYPLQIMELGLIAAKLTAPKPSISNAPAPIKALKNSTEVTKTPDEESMEEYAARRTKELRARH
jgi:hypothetical protein